MFDYFLRHWRGELPLPVAWWLNGVGLTVLQLWTDLRGGLFALFPEPETRLGIVAILTAGFLLALLVPAWQVIGIFRTAERRAAAGGTVLAARLAQSATTLLAILLATRCIIVAGESVPGVRLALGPESSYSVAVSHSGRLLEIRGALTFGLARDVERALSAHPAVRRVRLESGGGALSEARRLRALIVAGNLDTDSRSLCASACVSAYIGGRNRLLSRAARIGVHLPRNPGFGLRPIVSPAYAQELTYFADRGVPLWFLQRWVQSGREFWYPTPAQLREAGIVHTFFGRPRPGEEFYYR
ncbi:MAG: hypothetical protein QY320_14965 [Gammaproteobacteria bacterium]|nr:MAG: hypothetical protein QY320_14965 [Gammaproteobacteria bacterium]